MISGQLVHLIENNADQILKRVMYQIRHEEEMPRTQALLDSELREWNLTLLERLAFWLLPANREDLKRRFEHLGKIRFEQEVPLHETVRGLCLMREKTLDFVEEHIASNSSVGLQAEEELDRRVGCFFDLLIVCVVRGYERAMRRAASLVV